MAHVLMTPGQNGCDEGALEGEGTKHTEIVVRPEYLHGTAREVEVGCKVLVLVHSPTNKLLAQWQGPYEVLQQVGNVDYMIDMHDCKNRRIIFNVVMHAPGVLSTRRHARGRVLVQLRKRRVPKSLKSPTTMHVEICVWQEESARCGFNFL